MTAESSNKPEQNKKRGKNRRACFLLFFLLAASLIALFPITQKIDQYQSELEGVRNEIARLEQEETEAMTASEDRTATANGFAANSDRSDKAASQEKAELDGITADSTEAPQDGLSIQSSKPAQLRSVPGGRMAVPTDVRGSVKSRSSLISELLDKSAAGEARMERWGKVFKIFRSGIIILGFMLIYCVYISRQQRENEEKLPE